MTRLGRTGDASAIAGFRRATGTRFVAGRTMRLVAATGTTARVESARSMGVVTWKVRAVAARRGSVGLSCPPGALLGSSANLARKPPSVRLALASPPEFDGTDRAGRSEEHTSELQSPVHLVC